MNMLLENCSMRTGLGQDEVKLVVDTFLDEIVTELSKGHAVDLGDDFGIFSVGLRNGGNIQANSPRTPKRARYRTFFRENKGMRKRMVIDSGKVPGNQ